MYVTKLNNLIGFFKEQQNLFYPVRIKYTFVKINLYYS